MDPVESAEGSPVAEFMDPETVGGTSCGGELSPSGRSAEMISDNCSDANSKVLVKCVGENLLPAAQAW